MARLTPFKQAFRAAVPFGAFLAALVALPAAAELDGTLAALGWLNTSFPGKAENAWFAAGEGAIGVRSRRSVSLLHRPVSVDLEATPCLAWSWRVEETTVPPRDLSRRDGDRMLAIYVGFTFVPERATFGGKLRHEFLSRIAGSEVPGEALMYVWGGAHRAGEVVPSPSMGDDGVMRILRPAGTPLRTWLTERVDVLGEYRRAFGRVPPPVQEVAISSDTDDTEAETLGFVRDIGFVACGAERRS